MADSATTPAVKNIVEMEADVNVEFNEAASRQQINSGESVKTLFGKLRKFLADLKAVAFSGSYADLGDKPESLPANGGNADTVDGLHASDFVRAFNGTEMISNRVLIPNDVHVGNWLAANAKVGMCYYINSDNKGLTGLPDGDVGWAWFVYNGIEYFAKTIDDRLFYMNYINSYSGWSEIYTSKSKPYVTGTLSEQASDLPVTMSFTIFDFTPSKVICQFGNGNAFFANVVTNGFSLTIPAGTTTIHYIAFK